LVHRRRFVIPVLAALAAATGLLLTIGHSAQAASSRLPDRPIWRGEVRANSDASGLAQQEPSLAISRRDADVVVVAAKDFRETSNISRSVWIYTSHDGGRTWPWNQRFPPVSDKIFRHSDPLAVARDDGRMYVVTLGSGTPVELNHGLFLTWSDDDGVTWRPAVTITAQRRTFFDDKEWLAIDQSRHSLYYHRMYVAWRPENFDSMWLTTSADDGLTWSKPITVADGDVHSAYPLVDANGRLLVFFMDPLKVDAPGTIRFVASDDGGRTFGPPRAVADVQQPKSPLNHADQFRVYSIISAAVDPNDPDRFYVAWTDARDVSRNGVDALVVYSHDGGATWSQPLRLSSEPPGRVRDDFLPVIHVGARGRLHALWMDRRGDPNNVLVNAVYRASDDGGVTWGPTSRVSAVATDHNLGVPANSPSPGDYWGLDSVGNRVCAAWVDPRAGEEDVYVNCAWMTDMGLTYYLPAPFRNLGS
jgi:hypothetical protein